jgi:hypothetical protein
MARPEEEAFDDPVGASRDCRPCQVGEEAAQARVVLAEAAVDTTAGTSSVASSRSWKRSARNISPVA